MIMKKYISAFIAAVFTVTSVTGCASGMPQNPGNASSGATADSGDEISIVTTIFPEYDWVMNILGDNPAGAKVSMLLDNGVDLHSFQPTAEDIMRISDCDLFIYVGGESDEWVEDVLEEAVNKDMIVINLLETLGDSVKEEEIVEGMEGHDHDHDHEDDEEHDHEDGEEHDHEEGEEHDHDHEEPEFDEHVWLSLRCASTLTDSIAKALETIDSANAELYRKNADAYIAELSELDNKYEESVSKAATKTLLFGDRFPFRYMTDDYGLDYYAAFVGCSAETEASFETISFLANKVDELNLHAIMTIEGDNHKIAQTIADTATASDIEILTMDSMQSVTSKDVDAGATYLKIMDDNLAVLDKALK